MAHHARIQLAGLCAVASFIWTSTTFETHTLNQWPRFSACLILLLSAGLTWTVSYFSRWFPGPDGRFDETSSGLLNQPLPNSPERPRRYFAPAVVFCIVLRLELFHQIVANFQCSTPGVESFLCTFIVFYDVFFGHRHKPPTSALEPEDPWRSSTADLLDWLKQARLLLVGSVLLFNFGTYRAAASQKVYSTYMCSSLFDTRAGVVLMQVLGLGLDATIAILLWRILAFAKTTKARLRTVSSIQFSAAALVGLVCLLFRLRHAPILPSGFRGLGWLYVFDMVIDSFAFSVLAISTSLLISDAGPLGPLGIVTFFAGLSTSFRNLSSLNLWQGPSKVAVILPLHAIVIGFSVFLFTCNIRTVLFVRRVFFWVALFAVLAGTTIYTLFVSRPFHDRHPLGDIIYASRIEADRWLTRASTSNTLHVAVEEYRGRNHGRDPPPNFDKWFDFARSRASPIIDHFKQLGDDMHPFWGLKPEAIRQSLRNVLPEAPSIAWVKVAGGRVSHSYEAQDRNRKSLDSLVQMMESFSEHLQDMDIPINLGDGPRVLTPWVDLHGQRGPPSRGTAEGHVLPEAFLTPTVFQEMEAQTCPVGSSGRTLRHWNVRDLCFSCASRHAKGPFLVDWDASLDRCDQPDMAHLHGFYLSDKEVAPFQQLVPVFSRYKASGFNDILIPWPDPVEDEPDSNRDFRTRNNKLHWRGELGTHDVRGDEMPRGGHKQRLLHLVNNATSSEEIVMLLPRITDVPFRKGATWGELTFTYEKIHTAEANEFLPFDIGVSSYASCQDAQCAAAASEFGTKEMDVEAQEALRYRYVLLLDESLGPPRQFLRTVRSSSVPFLASVFRTWYTERLMPWVHFVPVDIRFQGLHSTLVYFAGHLGRKVGGRTLDDPGNEADAKWIALEGRSWARKALRREDMEVYLFRLLLEWGRVIDVDRDSIGFKFEE
ncbi:capsular associated protein [Sodiomyces alkalinus F11]|uniref:Capsular associated protein n=1 Tax=Sodiomyces alkalinus (strain CBS 110278 / VKM F-3762 / F11) TaxID=1314773 RepID=A0A3N2QA46_SODAK|nr:capsular associated protein [Sodiomyces alkalinus F11]ROT43633.1 capsular associated protein [Sodiomyces alkalinus F11]